MKSLYESIRKSFIWMVAILLVIVMWPWGGTPVQAATSLTSSGIKTTIPTAGAVGIDGTQPLKIEFDQPVKKGTGNITIKRISDNKEAITPIAVGSDARITVTNTDDPADSSGTIVTISELNLASGGYYVLIDEGAFVYSDESKNTGISDASQWTFWTSGVGAPSISTLTPLHGATGVLPSANLKINFSKDVYPASGTIRIYKNSDDSLVESISVTSSQVTGGGTSTITVDPASNLVNNTSYYVVVTAGAFRDAQLNETPAVAKGNWRFSVSTDTTALRVSTLSPTDGSTSVSTTGALTVTFNKELDPAYVGTVTLKKSNGANVAVTTEINATNLKQLRIFPDTTLENNTVYYVDIQGGVFRDAAGNVFAGLTGTSSWSFKTYVKDTTAPVLQSAKMYTNTIIKLTYNEKLNSLNPLSSSYTVTVNGEARDVSTAYISGDSVYVVLDTGVAVRQIVRISYTASLRPVQDVSLNSASAFSGYTVVNDLDSVMSKPTDGDVYGSTLTLYFPESVYVSSTKAKNQFTVKADNSEVSIGTISTGSSSAVVLYLNRSITDGEVVRVDYVPGSYPLEDSNDQSLAGFSNFYVRNELDTVAPVFQSAQVNGTKLTLTYNEALSTSNVPLKSQFSVLVNNTPLYVNAVEIQDDTITLTLASAITSNQNATLSYVPGALRVTDLNGNPAGYINLVPITLTAGNGNISSAVVQGDTLTVTFNSSLQTQSALTTSQFVVKENGTGVNVLSASSSGTTAVLKLSSAVTTGQTVTLAYSPEYVPLRDSNNQVITAFGPIAVTNNTSSTGSSTGSTTILPSWLTLRDSVLFGQQMYVASTDAVTSSQAQSRYGRSARQYAVDGEKLKQGLQYAANLGSSPHLLTFDVPTTDTVSYVSFPLSALQEAYNRDKSGYIGVRQSDFLWTIPLASLDFNSIAVNAGSTVTDTKLLLQMEPVPSTSSGTMDGLLLGNNAQKLAELTEVYLSASSSIRPSTEVQANSELSVRLTGSVNSETIGFVQFDKSIGRLTNVPHTAIQLNGATVFKGKLTSNQTVTIAQHVVSFSDLGSHWAKTTLETLASKWIIDGMNGAAYQPDTKITRAEFAIMVAKGLGLSGSQETTQRFSDVSYGSVASAYIGAAAKAGIITGNTDGTFKPNNLITREQMAIMMVRALEYGGQSVDLQTSAASTLSRFKDNNKIQSKEQVAKAVQQGIIQGMTSTTFQPQGNATRAQAGVMLERVLKKLGYL